MQTLITPGDQSSRVRSSRRSATAPALGQGRDFGACGLSIRSSFLSRGIGASLVEGFRKIGYSVVANSRSIDTAGDPAVLVVDGDIAGRDTAERIVDGAIERFGRIDTLVNNAGIFIPKQFIDYSEADFATMIAVNLGGSSTSRRRQQPGCFGRVPAISSTSRQRSPNSPSRHFRRHLLLLTCLALRSD